MKANGAPRSQHALPVVILGTDAALAAAPATPVQLAHACLRAGFASVIPANWGDELVASAVLRRLADHGPGPVIQCTCPIVAHRLLSVSGDLRNVMVPLVSPPVAVARYVRALSQPGSTRITYVGACPGALDESIDIRMTPAALLELLAERQIVPEDQPRMFESVLPPDRRRYWSQPGGLPAPELLWREVDARTLVEISADDIPVEIAQQLLSGKPVLIDAAARLGCVCSGAGPDVPMLDARNRVTALEPPRSNSPVIEDRPDIELDLPIPAASRTPVDVIAVIDASGPNSRISPPETNQQASQAAPRPTPNREAPFSGAVEQRPARPAQPPSTHRPVLGGVPIARDGEGRSLPRAYVARRRPSPKSNVAVPPPSPWKGRSVDTTPRLADAPPSGGTPTVAPAPSIGGLGFSPLADARSAPVSAQAGPVVALGSVQDERVVSLTPVAEPPPASPAAGPPFSGVVGSPPGAPAAAMGASAAQALQDYDDAEAARSTRHTPRDMAAATSRARVEEFRRDARRRVVIAVLIFAGVAASVATGVVIGRWFTPPATPSAASP